MCGVARRFGEEIYQKVDQARYAGRTVPILFPDGAILEGTLLRDLNDDNFVKVTIKVHGALGIVAGTWSVVTIYRLLRGELPLLQL